jgi:hypothetical protein
MRSSKLALSALAIAFALGGSAYAAGTAAPEKPAASSTAHAAQPAKHRLFKKKSTKKSAVKHSTSTTSTGAH